MENCKKAAKTFNALAAGSGDELFAVCAGGLDAFANGCERYKADVSYAVRFVDDLKKDLESVCGDTCQDIQSAAFAIVEDLAVLMRESSLRSGGMPTDAERRLMGYFEQNEQWRLGDGNLVSDYYYNLVPVAVMNSLNKPA